METMTVRKFNTKDEFMQAIADCQGNKKPVKAFKYHFEIDLWMESEVM